MKPQEIRKARIQRQFKTRYQAHLGAYSSGCVATAAAASASASASPSWASSPVPPAVLGTSNSSVALKNGIYRVVDDKHLKKRLGQSGRRWEGSKRSPSDDAARRQGIGCPAEKKELAHATKKEKRATVYQEKIAANRREIRAQIEQSRQQRESQRMLAHEGEGFKFERGDWTPLPNFTAKISLAQHQWKVRELEKSVRSKARARSTNPVYSAANVVDEVRPRNAYRLTRKGEGKAPSPAFLNARGAQVRVESDNLSATITARKRSLRKNIQGSYDAHARTRSALLSSSSSSYSSGSQTWRGGHRSPFAARAPSHNRGSSAIGSGSGSSTGISKSTYHSKNAAQSRVARKKKMHSNWSWGSQHGGSNSGHQSQLQQMIQRKNRSSTQQRADANQPSRRERHRNTRSSASGSASSWAPITDPSAIVFGRRAGAAGHDSTLSSSTSPGVPSLSSSSSLMSDRFYQAHPMAVNEALKRCAGVEQVVSSDRSKFKSGIMYIESKLKELINSSRPFSRTTRESPPSSALTPAVKAATSESPLPPSPPSSLSSCLPPSSRSTRHRRESDESENNNKNENENENENNGNNNEDKNNHENNHISSSASLTPDDSEPLLDNTSPQSGCVRANTCLHLLEVVSECLNDTSAEAFNQLILKHLKALIISSEYKGIVDGTEVDPAVTVELLEKRADYEARQFYDRIEQRREKERKAKRKQKLQQQRKGHANQDSHDTTSKTSDADSVDREGGGEVGLVSRSADLSSSPSSPPPSSLLGTATGSQTPAKRRKNISLHPSSSSSSSSSSSPSSSSSSSPSPSSSSSSSSHKTELIRKYDFRSNLSYRYEPYFEVAQRLTHDILAVNDRLQELQREEKALTRRLEGYTTQLEFLNDWDKKKDLQLLLYSRSKDHFSMEIVQLTTTLEESEEGLEKLIEENHTLEQRYVNDGTFFGGIHDFDQDKWEEYAQTYMQQLQTAVEELKQEGELNAKTKQEINETFKARDMLLTRIEVFEQAVHMMHHQLDRIKQKEGKTGPDSLSMRQVEKKSRLIKEQLLKARLGYSVNKDLLATLRTTNQKNWCNKLFDSDLKGWGTGPRVPVFMRFHGYIRNTQMDEADALLRVKEVWSFKTLHDNQLKDEGRGGQTSSLSSFFIQYLDRRYRSSDRDRVEFVYNFVACMCRFFTRSSFAIFAKILFGDLHERHFYDMVVLVSNLKDMLSRWDVASSENVREHVIKKTVFVANLQRFFPRKTARDFEELILIAERDARIPSFEEFGECYDVLRLLMDDKGGDDTNFLECVKSQYMEEVEAFLTDIRTQLWQKAGWRDPPLRQHKFAKMQQRTPEDMNLSSAQKKMMTEAKARARKRFGGDGGGSSREGGDALHPQPHAHSSDGDEDTRSMDQVSLSCAEIETVLFSVDPGKTRAEVREYLVRGTQDVYVSASTRASIEVFCENLLSGLLTRSHHWVRLQGQMTVGTV